MQQKAYSTYCIWPVHRDMLLCTLFLVVISESLLVSSLEEAKGDLERGDTRHPPDVTYVCLKNI